MIKILIYLYICISFLFSQKIYHDPIVSVESELPIEVDIFTDLQGQNILNYNIFYRKIGQTGYFQESLNSQDGTYYSAIIPSEFVVNGDIEYYILLETESNTVSIPEINPYLNPLTILLTKNTKNSQNISTKYQKLFSRS